MNLLTNTILLDEDELRMVLKDIQNGQNDWDEKNKSLIVQSMINHIGSIDSELRDNLIYGSFCQLIIEKNILEHNMLKKLLELSINELLFKGIEENGTDTVFIRSFTSLLVALILYRDNEDNFLSKSTVYKIKDRLIDYINLENDLRGYVSVKGWAHSIAHVADAFEELIKNPKINQESFIEILKTLWNKIFVSTSVYIHDEDERILIPILEMLNRGLEQKEIETLVQNIPIQLKNQKEQIEEEQYWFLYSNCKTFLKSFYIKVESNRDLIPLRNSLEKCLSEISLYS